MIKKQRLMTIRMNIDCLKPKPTRDFWITKAVNCLTLIVTKAVDYDYSLAVMQ
jgi:hypothetical protein